MKTRICAETINDPSPKICRIFPNDPCVRLEILCNRSVYSTSINPYPLASRPRLHFAEVPRGIRIHGVAVLAAHELKHLRQELAGLHPWYLADLGRNDSSLNGRSEKPQEISDVCNQIIKEFPIDFPSKQTSLNGSHLWLNPKRDEDLRIFSGGSECIHKATNKL